MNDESTHISVSNNVGGVAEGPVTQVKKMSSSQAGRLKLLCAERGLPFEEGLNADEAARRIEELDGKAGPRGIPQP